jgi:CHRD domain
MRLRAFLICVCVGLVTSLTLSIGALAGDSGRPLATVLTGAAEVPGPGDPDGSGTAVIRLNPGQGQVCFELSVSNITLPATGAHIHVGTATEAGPVVVPLTPPDASGTSSGCVSADAELIKAIIQNPENYYVNVHTVPLYAAGAVRGQLSK